MSASTVPVVYVTSPRCKFCERGSEVLAALAAEFPLSVREIALDSPEGRETAVRWRVPYPPIVLIEGRLAGYGRLSERRLRQLLAVRDAEVAR